ncbi:MAG: AAA family ATPase [Candidatus Riflebacteria bacterium]|nr:AAA family ATPase [Candidatus Riflebacteria bacterium]
MEERFDKQDLLSLYCREMAKDEAAPDPLADDRQIVVKRLCRDLADRRSVILVGPPGVGKSTLIHQLAAQVRLGQCPPELSGTAFYQASCSMLMAGTQYLGEWESKIFHLIRMLGRRSVLYVMDVWNLLGAGSHRGSAKDLYDTFKGHLERGDTILVGEMTEERLAAVTAREPSFPQLFTVHRLGEPDAPTVRRLLFGHAKRLAKRYRVEVGEETVERVITLTRKFIPYEVFPGKGVRLLEKVFAETSIDEGRRTVDPATVFRIFALYTGLPLWLLDGTQTMDVESTRAFSSARGLGQDEAIGRVVDTVAIYKARLNEPRKPIGVFFFVGPTGVGKTELAKTLATFLFGSADRMVRLDMSEYAGHDCLEKLLGKRSQGDDLGPAGQGFLTGRVREQPFSVVLLDEIEKAHAAVHNLMLQVFSDGRLTDARGETADFRNAIIILTSNVGASHVGSEIGFGGKLRQLKARIHKEMETHFRPEFLNRLEHVVVFQPLDQETMHSIARREFDKLAALEGLKELSPILEVEDEAVTLLVKRGFDPKFGARPLKRAIKALVTTPLAHLLVTKAARPRQIIRVLAAGDEIRLDVEATEASARSEVVDEAMEVVPEGADRPVRVTPREVNASIEGILGRIERAEQAFGLDRAEVDLKEMEELMVAAELASDPERSTRLLARYHRLFDQVRQFRDVRELARIVFEATDLTMAERDPSLLKEISRDYGRLLGWMDRLDLESSLFADTDRRDALLIVAAAGVGPADRSWVEELAGIYEGWARVKRYSFKVLYSPEAAIKATGGEVAVKALVEGSCAYGYLAGERGLHRLTRKKVQHRREVETVAARVEVYPVLRSDDEVEGIAGREPQIETVRTKEGRVGKVAYRIRVAGSGPEIVLANGLTEVENRKLGTIAWRSLAAAVATGRQEPQKGIVRSYDTAENHVVKDKRTGVTVHNIRRVFAGEIDDFLVPYLRGRPSGG